MIMTDPLADMLTRIRNAHLRSHRYVETLSSTVRRRVLDVLRDEGYIEDYRDAEDGYYLRITLKYDAGKKAIQEIKRISKPGCRVYCSCEKLPVIANGLGICIVSTSQGVMSDVVARKKSLGGEVLCSVY